MRLSTAGRRRVIRFLSHKISSESVIHLLLLLKRRRNLKKLLSKDIEFIYDKKEKQLIFNANLSEPGYGEEGGIFAIEW